MYTYNQKYTDDATFLPPIVLPENIVSSDLDKMATQCALNLVGGNVILDALKARFGTTDTIPDSWVYSISKNFLEPVGISKNVRFSWNEATVADIKTRNPSLSKEKFYLPTNTNRPFPIIGTTLVGPSVASPYDSDNQNLTLIEITPLYVGQLKTQNVRYNYHHDSTYKVKKVGGAIETFAFSRVGGAPLTGLQPGRTNGTLNVPPRRPYSICSMLRVPPVGRLACGWIHLA